MLTVSIGQGRWHADAHRALEKGNDVEVRARGWRARVLRAQLPKISAAAVAYKSGKRLPERDNFSLWFTVLLLRFHELLFFALAHGYAISWDNLQVDVTIVFRKIPTPVGEQPNRST